MLPSRLQYGTDHLCALQMEQQVNFEMSNIEISKNKISKIEFSKFEINLIGNQLADASQGSITINMFK